MVFSINVLIFPTFLEELWKLLFTKYFVFILVFPDVFQTHAAAPLVVNTWPWPKATDAGNTIKINFIVYKKLNWLDFVFCSMGCVAFFSN